MREEGAFILFLCWFFFVFSLSKKPYLAWNRDLLFFADEIKGAVCEWRNTLSDCSIASQSGFAWINILGSQHLSVPYSACFIIIINIPFCHVSCLWFKLVESTSMFWKQKKEVKNLSLRKLQSSCLLGPSVFCVTDATEHKVSIVYAWLCSCSVPAKQAGASLHWWNCNINVIGLLRSNLICCANSLTSSD